MGTLIIIAVGAIAIIPLSLLIMWIQYKQGKGGIDSSSKEPSSGADIPKVSPSTNFSEDNGRLVHCSTRDTQVGTLEVSAYASSHYVEVHQKTHGELPAIPISAWDGYISPSGGFVNFGRYQVTGKNPNTNRKNKRTYEVKNEEDARKCAEDAGLVGPFEVSVLPATPPTDAQLSYAKDLGAMIPEGACKTDVSAIISRITDGDESPVSERLARKAHECGIKFSRYHGRKAILALARNLPVDVYLEVARTM